MFYFKESRNKKHMTSQKLSSSSQLPHRKHHHDVTKEDNRQLTYSPPPTRTTTSSSNNNNPPTCGDSTCLEKNTTAVKSKQKHTWCTLNCNSMMTFFFLYLSFSLPHFSKTTQLLHFWKVNQEHTFLIYWHKQFHRDQP